MYRQVHLLKCRCEILITCTYNVFSRFDTTLLDQTRGDYGLQTTDALTRFQMDIVSDIYPLIIGEMASETKAVL